MLKLVIISDTHTQGRALKVPDGDVLIHCGDSTYRGTGPETHHEMEWFSALPHKHKIIIAGNHELGWEADLDRNFYRQVPITKPHFLDKYPDLIYLHNTEVTINGVRFWGSPYQPEFYNWAFMKKRGPALAANWAEMPEGIDVLITHGPPYGFGDVNESDNRFGDEDLLKRVLDVKPQIHCYGHAHHGYGEYFHDGIHFINAASLNEDYNPVNAPVVVDVSSR